MRIDKWDLFMCSLIGGLVICSPLIGVYYGVKWVINHTPSKIKKKKLDLNKIKIKNAEVEAYEYSFDENGTKLYAISYFIILKENLLIANFYSISEKETEKMLEYFYNIEKIN